MVTDNQRLTANVDWSDQGLPVSTRFDDPYFSLENGLAESSHVFLAGNGLPDRFKPGFHIGELGFGTGLNMCAAWLAWRQSGQTTPLRYTSFEAYPMRGEDIRKALASFTEITREVANFLEVWAEGKTRFNLDLLEAEVVIGDARKMVSEFPSKMDAWFLDGFAPAKNPELWQPALMADIAAHTNPDGTFATYSAAGFVRRTMADVGFTTDRLPGFGRKRHMSIGRLSGQA